MKTTETVPASPAVLQVGEQILPRLQTDEAPREQDTVIEIRPNNPLTGIGGGELH